MECTSWLVLFSAGGRRSVRVGWFYFQLEVGGVYELVGSIFSWRWVECTSLLVIFSAGCGWGVRVGSDHADGFVPVQDRRRRAHCEV